MADHFSRALNAKTLKVAITSGKNIGDPDTLRLLGDVSRRVSGETLPDRKDNVRPDIEATPPEIVEGPKMV